MVTDPSRRINSEPRSSLPVKEGMERCCSGWICFSGQDWWYHNRAHSDFQLMRRIAKQRPVLFINSIGMRMPMPGRTTKAGRRVLRKVKSFLRFLKQPISDTPNFYVFTPLILPFYGSKWMRVVNYKLVRRQVRMLARYIGIDEHNAIVFLTIPTAWEVVRALPYRALLYNRSDLHSAFEETDQFYIRELEHRLFATCDSVLYASHSLMESEIPLVGDRAVFLDHGVDLKHFASAIHDEPKDLAAIPRPRIGFFGGIDDYVVDLNLIENLARSIPNASVVLIGDATCSMARFNTISNVYWLGFRCYEQIPAYGKGFDVAIMPWLRNQWIEHSNPIKLKEYLALGLPVVSTDFPEVHHYSDTIAIGSDDDEFIQLVRAALDGHAVGSATARKKRIADATWDKQANLLLSLAEGIKR